MLALRFFVAKTAPLPLRDGTSSVAVTTCDRGFKYAALAEKCNRRFKKPGRACQAGRQRFQKRKAAIRSRRGVASQGRLAAFLFDGVGDPRRRRGFDSKRSGERIADRFAQQSRDAMRIAGLRGRDLARYRNPAVNRWIFRQASSSTSFEVA
jgi:hypothetical protein